MDRRRFLSGAVLVGATAVAGADAFAAPRRTNRKAECPDPYAGVKADVTWQVALPPFNPKEILPEQIRALSETLVDLTEGRFRLTIVSANGDLLDQVRDGHVECCAGPAGAYAERDPSFGFEDGLPFGMNSRQQNAWLYQGGGMTHLRELWQSYGVTSFAIGNTGVPMGGWFRREVSTIADFQGLKIQVNPFAARLVSAVGGLPQSHRNSATVLAELKDGRLDAAAWGTPYDEELLGFNDAAAYYYYPSLWEGGVTISIQVNLKAWETLPIPHRMAFTAACAQSNLMMQTRCDTLNAQAISRLVSNGTTLRPFSPDLMVAMQKQAFDLYDSLSRKDRRFAKIYGEWLRFRDDLQYWWKAAEFSFDAFVLTAPIRDD